MSFQTHTMIVIWSHRFNVFDSKICCSLTHIVVCVYCFQRYVVTFKDMVFHLCLLFLVGLNLCTCHTWVKSGDGRLWSQETSIKTEDSFGKMFKLIGSNYSMWKSKMRDRLVCKNLWLLVQHGKSKLDKIDTSTW